MWTSFKVLLLTLCLAGSAAAQITTGGSSSASNGTGGSTNPAEPIMGFYITNACPVANTGQCYFTFADTQEFNDISWGTSNGVLTANSNEFTAAMVGMSVVGNRTCSGDTAQAIATAGAIAPNATPPKVITFTSATSITINATPVNAQTLVSTAPVGGCLIIGHPDDTTFALLDAAVQAVTSFCPKIFFAAANYWISKPYFFTNPTGCGNTGPQLGGSFGVVGFGSVTLPAGMELEGRGTDNTALYLDSSFPNGDGCAHTEPGGNAANVGGCFSIPPLGAWRDFRIDGGGQGNPTGAAGHTLIYASVAKIKDFLCLNYGGYTGSNSIGIELTSLNQLDLVNNSGCGSIGVWVDNAGSGNIANRLVVESSSFNALLIAGPTGGAEPSLACYWCNFAMSNSSALTPNAVIQNRGGFLRMFGGRVYAGNGNEATTINGVSMYRTQTTNGSQLYAEGVNLFGNAGGASNTNGGILCVTTCINTLIGSIVNSQSSGSDYTDVAGSVLNDIGGNTYTPRFTVSGQVVNEANSANGIGITAAKLVLSGGWGTTAANTALSGGNAPIQFTITNSGTGQGASPTITYTFPTKYPVAPFSCTATQVGGTNATGTFTSSALSATGVTFTFSLTPTAASTEIVQVTCVTP